LKTSNSQFSLSNPHYAGFWIRVAATIIDSILLAAIIVPILLAVYGKEYLSPHIVAGSVAKGPIDFLLTWILPIIAILIFWHAKSATPGKMLFSLKIVDAKTGEKPSTKQFIIRYLGYYVSAIPFLVGFYWIAFDKRKQGWHDKIAGTVVIYNS
jgi:uncharacterized RDD family membrane protein YckC